MTGRRIFVYALIAAILPAIAITAPTSKAYAKDGRNAAIVAGIVAGAVGAAILYESSNQRWRTVPNHYHRNGFVGCHTHNGIYHCHRATSRRPSPRYRPAPPTRRYRPAPWTREWYRYCRNRYRSFNPRTGYFMGYDGRRHFCR